MSQGSASQRSLVLVEDDLGDALLVEAMLSAVAPDMRILPFRTLQSALDGWPSDADCVLLDLGLPDAAGLQALEMLREQAPDVPVVVLTGRIDDTVGPDALAAGAQDFLVKGQVDGPGLERSLRYAVERGRAVVDQHQLVAAELRAQENTRLQRGLLPNPVMKTAALRLALFYRPGSERALLGGDFYDVVQTETGVHLLIGDVSGHGPDEAALGVALRISWRALVMAGLPAEDVVRGVERVLLAERDDDEHFATVAMLSLGLDLGRAQLLLCGHPAPVLIRGDHAIELSAEPSPMLSMLAGGALETNTVALGGSWGLLLFTDGLVEGSSTPGSSDRLGVGGLVSRLQLLMAQGVERSALAPALVEEAERCNGGVLSDDVAVLLIGTADWWA